MILELVLGVVVWCAIGVVAAEATVDHLARQAAIGDAIARRQLQDIQRFPRLFVVICAAAGPLACVMRLLP